MIIKSKMVKLCMGRGEVDTALHKYFAFEQSSAAVVTARTQTEITVLTP